MTLDERLTRVVPSERQLRHQALEFYGFVHFGMNTFTDREWGDGREDPALFDPPHFDPGQWARAFRDAGMRGMILTCKHHDGFCLWPTKTTAHSVASSPWRGGRGDAVRETAAACRKYGLRFGVYLSPWDRNCPVYGEGAAYDDFFLAQLTELLTGYGEVFSVWLDGACGEGPGGKKQVYDWARYHARIRELQPGACISVCGPDVRWCGNEAGHTRPAEWSVVPERTKESELTAEKSQKTDGAAFRLRPVDARDEDLGSRDALRFEEKLIWYPAEVNTSIRPGWFWHESENARVRPLAELLQIYERSVGGNATLLLNVPPAASGLLCPEDTARLRALGAAIRAATAKNLLDDAALVSDGENAEALRREGGTAFRGRTVTALWDREVRIGWVVLREDLRMSQRVERFTLEARRDGVFREVFSGTVIGHKRIVPLDVSADGLRLVIRDSRLEPALSFFAVCEKPGESGSRP